MQMTHPQDNIKKAKRHLYKVTYTENFGFSDHAFLYLGFLGFFPDAYLEVDKGQ